jgi:hypothetical protein
MSDVPAQARAGAGLFAWISKWRRADDPRSPQMLGDEIVRLYTRGLSAA